ncbi:twin-arginine translocase subunit TatC [Paenibacillus sp. SC116]|uniref:twin-arginine translocase subunit TatC n=1 Tax=Paenibacillus sp. SC116 TaxID=2968986 RepID=UPI00215AB6F5|nr:twin-arginine translocase subunit TatC [Paenibacillus sp. SC116]MCR8844139.1 twin-arginine translocase subunit TatC [Paenibacillus sp. SC116]
MSQDTEQQLSVIEHITELRRRIMYIVAVLIAGLIGGFFLAEPLFQYVISRPPADVYTFKSFSPWDGVGIYMKFAFLVALSLTLPFIMYQLWAFVSPGLRKHERMATLKYIPFVFVLFIAGMCFAYYIVAPMAFQFTANVNQQLGLQELYGITHYLTFLFNLVLPMALLFELPLVIMFLTAIRILNPLRLRKMRRFAYFGLVLIGVSISPPDFISDILITIPLILLYEFSVLLSSFIYRNQLARDKAWEEEFEAGHQHSLS